MKLVVKPYCHKTWKKGEFKQVTPIPSLTICHNPYGWFIEQGVHTDLFVIGFGFLIWDIGLQFYRDLEIRPE